LHLEVKAVAIHIYVALAVGVSVVTMEDKDDKKWNLATTIPLPIAMLTVTPLFNEDNYMLMKEYLEVFSVVTMEDKDDKKWNLATTIPLPIAMLTVIALFNDDNYMLMKEHLKVYYAWYRFLEEHRDIVANMYTAPLNASKAIENLLQFPLHRKKMIMQPRKDVPGPFLRVPHKVVHWMCFASLVDICCTGLRMYPDDVCVVNAAFQVLHEATQGTNFRVLPKGRKFTRMQWYYKRGIKKLSFRKIQVMRRHGVKNLVAAAANRHADALEYAHF